ncbi:MAG: class I SAM-dependent methyltransferase [Pseudomonadota bacterium]
MSGLAEKRVRSAPAPSGAGSAWTGPDGLTHAGPLIDTVDGVDLISCELCGFVHVIPLPEPEAAAEHYKSDYYTETKPTYLSHATEDAAWQRVLHNDLLLMAETILGSSQRTLVDIGCGPGLILDAAADRGWTCSGLEPSRQAAQFAAERGHTVINAPFTPDVLAEIGEVDLVSMINVLEHVPHPSDFIDWANQLLQPGGLLLLTVPNDFNGFQRTLRATGATDAWWISPHHHLNYFSFETLENLVKAHGFEPLLRTTSYPMELFALTGRNYVAEPEQGRGCHKDRRAFDLAFEAAGLSHVRRTFYEGLAQAGLGREATIIAQKP